MTPLAYSGMRELHLREWHCTLCDFFLNKVFLCPNLTTALKVMFFSLVLVHGNCLKLSIQGQPCLLCAAIHSEFFFLLFSVL